MIWDSESIHIRAQEPRIPNILNWPEVRSSAAARRGASNSPRRPCVTKPYREATASSARTGSWRLSQVSRHALRRFGRIVCRVIGKLQPVQGVTFDIIDDQPQLPTVRSYDMLNKVLDEAGFDTFVEETCGDWHHERFVCHSRPQGTLFRILLLGPGSECRIALHICESCSLSAFLGIEFGTSTPAPSALTHPQAHRAGIAHRCLWGWSSYGRPAWPYMGETPASGEKAVKLEPLVAGARKVMAETRRSAEIGGHKHAPSIPDRCDLDSLHSNLVLPSYGVREGSN